MVSRRIACLWDTVFFLRIETRTAPVISPKKSVEGAVFGTLITSVLNIIVLLVFELIARQFGHEYLFVSSGLRYLVLVPISWALSIVSMFGDLAASVLKRNVGIKDYSNLLPGHGGIMDRFDSTLFVLPVLYGILDLMF